MLNFSPPDKRLPPGQYWVPADQFPVLDLGTQPEYDPQTFRLEISGLVEQPQSLSLAELRKLPAAELTADFHCVTTWSKRDVIWKGVSWQQLEELVQPTAAAKFVIEFGLDGYTTNVPLADLRSGETLIAYQLYGKPIPQEHGAPLRLIVPQLYGWKGSKFLHKLDFRLQDQPGFWETRGYHNHGDPYKQERYS